MRTSISCAALLVTILSSYASAQAVMYHHRSTVYGDYLSGAADLVLARGRAARHYADAYAISVRADNDLEELRQKRLRAYYYEQEYKDQLSREKAEARRLRQESAQTALNQDAEELVRRYRLGVFVWPAALQRPEYSTSTRLVETLLARWTPGEGPTFNAYRTSLLTEAGVLRTRIAENPNIRFEEKSAAVRLLKTLQHLAGFEVGPAEESAQRLAAR